MIFVDPLSYEDWLKWRLLGIGGSDAATIMGVSPWETPLELWLRRTGRLAPKEQTFAMRRGLRLEPRARREYELRTGIPVPKQLGIHEVHPWIRASFDGFNWQRQRVVEIKCPGREAHALACRGIVPPHYVWQCVHLMLVSGLKCIDYFSYDERTTALVTIKYDAAREAEYIRKAVRFWTYIERDVPPPGIIDTRVSKRKVWAFPVRRKAG